MTSNSRNEELELPVGLEPRCRRVYGWNANYAAKAVAAYRQFMKLKLQQEDWNATILSPSDTVDKVWHQHILDLKEYVNACEDYCDGNLIGHNPDGGLDVQAKRARIKNTKLCLKTLFGRDGVDASVWFGDEGESDDEDDSDEEVQGGDRRNRRRITMADIERVKLQFCCSSVDIGIDQRSLSMTCSKHDRLEAVLLHWIEPERITNLLFWYEYTQLEKTDTPRSMLPPDDEVICPFLQQKIKRGLPITVIHRSFGLRSSDRINNEPLTIRIRDQTGEETFFRIKKSTRMGRVFVTYAQRKGVSSTSLRFLLDGERIEPWYTPIALDLDEQDQIDVMLEQTGC